MQACGARPAALRRPRFARPTHSSTASLPPRAWQLWSQPSARDARSAISPAAQKSPGLGAFSTPDRFDWNHRAPSTSPSTSSCSPSISPPPRPQRAHARTARGRQGHDGPESRSQSALAGLRRALCTLAVALADLLKQESAPEFERRILRYTLPPLLILDELGYLPCDSRPRACFTNIVSRRHEQRSIIATFAGRRSETSGFWWRGAGRGRHSVQVCWRPHYDGALPCPAKSRSTRPVHVFGLNPKDEGWLVMPDTAPCPMSTVISAPNMSNTCCAKRRGSFLRCRRSASASRCSTGLLPRARPLPLRPPRSSGRPFRKISLRANVVNRLCDEERANRLRNAVERRQDLSRPGARLPRRAFRIGGCQLSNQAPASTPALSREAPFTVPRGCRGDCAVTSRCASDTRSIWKCRRIASRSRTPAALVTPGPT